MPIKLPISSTIKETKVSIEELKELVDDYREHSPFASKCVWISQDLLNELAKRNKGHEGFRIYFAGFEWDDKDRKNPKEDMNDKDDRDDKYGKGDKYERMQKVQTPVENRGPKKYQSLIFVSTDGDQEDLLDDNNYVVVGEKPEADVERESIQALRICPPPPPNDCKGRLF